MSIRQNLDKLNAAAPIAPPKTPRTQRITSNPKRVTSRPIPPSRQNIGEVGTRGDEKPAKVDGNLYNIDDTWKRINNFDFEISETCVRERSDARIDVSFTSARMMESPKSNMDAKTWTVTSPIQFQYRVVETPNLLDPRNNS